MRLASPRFSQGRGLRSDTGAGAASRTGPGGDAPWRALVDSGNASSSFAGALGIGTTTPGSIFSINGVAYSGDGNISALPPAVNGGYCIQASAGGLDYAAFATW